METASAPSASATAMAAAAISPRVRAGARRTPRSAGSCQIAVPGARRRRRGCSLDIRTVYCQCGTRTMYDDTRTTYERARDPLLRPASPRRASATASATSGRCATSTSTSPPAPSSDCSATTARARPPRSASSPRCAPHHRSCTVAGLDVAAEPAAVRARIGLAGQQATIDGLLSARANLGWSPGSTTSRAPRHTPAPTSCSSASTSSTRPTAWRAPSPVACAAASTSRPASSPTRPSSSSTSRPRASTRAAAPISGPSCASASRPGPRCC